MKLVHVRKTGSQINIVLIIRYLNKNIVHYVDSLINSIENANENISLNNKKIYKKQFENHENPRDFWSTMGRLGLANDRRTSIPWEINDDDGVMKTDKNIVLHKWKTVYEQLFNQE